MRAHATVLGLVVVSGCSKEPARGAFVAGPPTANTSAEATPAVDTGAIDAGAAAHARRPLAHLPGAASEVISDDGDIVAKDGAGNEARLTATGMDLWPVLAPDRTTIVFSRGRNARDDWPRDLYLARVDRGDPELLVAEDPDKSVDILRLVGLASPEFSIDGKRVLFEVQNGFHNPGLCAIDLETRTITLLATQKAYAQIRRGPHRGQLLILHFAAQYRSNGSDWECEIVDGANGRRVAPHDCYSTRALTGSDDIFGLKP
jgi:hypothetical protein